MLLAIPAAWPLWRRAGRDLDKRIGVVVYCVSLVVCYGGSGLYHSVPGHLVAACQTLDHIGIFLLIAGTVTPIGLVVLDGRRREALLGGIWLLAAVGIGLRLLTNVPIGVLTVLYLIMGWVGCLTYFELARRLTHAGVRPLWVGGLLYSIGAIINVLGWPVLLPGVFGSHELFHLFVMAGSGCHYLFILRRVLAYEATPSPSAPPSCRTRSDEPASAGTACTPPPSSRRGPRASPAPLPASRS